MTSFDQIEDHLGVEEAAFRSLDHELGEPCLRRARVHLDDGGGDVALDGRTSPDSHRDEVRHVLVQALVDVGFVETETLKAPMVKYNLL